MQKARPVPRAEQVADTRRRLLTSARRLFLNRGFHATSLADVAADAGFTKGAVFSQFADKADLFLALLEQQSTRRVAIFEALRFEQPTADGLARAIALDWRQNVGEKPRWTLLLIEFRVFAARNQAVGRRYAEIHDRLCATVAGLLGRHRAEAGLESTVDADSAARVALAISTGVLLEQVAAEGMDGTPLVAALTRGMMRPKGRST